MNGSIKLKTYGFSHYTVYGGAYPRKPSAMMGLSLREHETPDTYAIHVPTKDFQTPPLDEMNAGMLELLARMRGGTPMYVGCTAGWGRTGTFLACLVKAWGANGDDSPVKWLRRHYCGEAVEKPIQHDFIDHYQAPADIKKLIRSLKWQGLFRFGNLTNYTE